MHNRDTQAKQAKLERYDQELLDRDKQMRHQSESLQNLEATLGQFKDKCFQLEE